MISSNFAILSKLCDFWWIMRKVAIWGQLCEIATSQNIRSPDKRILIKCFELVDLSLLRKKSFWNVRRMQFDVYIKTHFKATKKFRYTHFSSCHPSGDQGSQKASSRAKHSDVSKATPLKQHLKLLFHKSHRKRLSWNSCFNNSRTNYIWGEKT